jgi:PAS domain S-box-containing protein
MGMQVDTSNWVALNFDKIKTYFWSILAIVADVFFLAIFWELIGKIKRLPMFIKIFLVIFGVFLLDAVIFTTGVFWGNPVYLSILKGHLIVRFVLAVIATPFIVIYLNTDKYDEEKRDKPKTIWEILNFHSDLESKIENMEEVLKEEKKLEEELKKSEEKYALALQGANAGIWDWDIEKDNVMYSAKFHALLGFNEGELKSKIDDFKEMLHPDDVDRTMATIDDCFKNKKPYNVEYRLKNKDGSYKWYLSGGVVKFDDSGKPIRMVGSIIDIDEKKSIDKSYEDKVSELEKLNKAIINRELKMLELKKELQKSKE